MKLLTLFFCSFAAAAQAKMGIMASFVAQRDAPVDIVSLTKTNDDMGAHIVLQNNAPDKLVESVTIGWTTDMTAVPCAAGAPIPTQIAQHRYELAVPGGGAKGELFALGPKTDDVGAHMKAAGASFASIQIAVLEVQFSDGSRWTSPLARDSTFDKTRLSELTQAVCKKDGLLSGNAPKCTSPRR